MVFTAGKNILQRDFEGKTAKKIRERLLTPQYISVIKRAIWESDWTWVTLILKSKIGTSLIQNEMNKSLPWEQNEVCSLGARKGNSCGNMLLFDRECCIDVAICYFEVFLAYNFVHGHFFQHFQEKNQKVIKDSTKFLTRIKPSIGLMS